MGRPKSKVATVETTPNVRLSKSTGRYHWEVERGLEDGGTFRKAGSAKTLEAAITKRDAAVAEYEAILAGKVAGDSGLTVEGWADQCLERIWPEEVGERTAQGYGDIVRVHIRPNIGHIKLTKLSYDHLMTLDAKLKADGKAAQTRRNVRNCVSKLYTTAERHRKVDQGTNPAKLWLIKAETKRDDAGNKVSHKRTLTPDEIAALKAKVKGTTYEAAVWLGLYLGLRIGEIVGLRWRSVDLDGGWVTIVEQRQYVRGKGHKLTDPKTAAGQRRLPIPTLLADYLRTLPRTKSGYVVTKMNGDAATAHMVSHWFGEIVCDAGLCGKVDAHGVALADPTPHDMRHTWCYHMANGWPKGGDDGKVTRTPSVPLVTLSKMAGHASITVTAGYYVDVAADDMVTAMSYVG